MVEDNLYFIDTPVEIQEDCYNFIVSEISELDIPYNKNVYAKMIPIYNLPGKYYFNIYIHESFKDNLQPDFLIFIQ